MRLPQIIGLWQKKGFTSMTFAINYINDVMILLSCACVKDGLEA